MEDAQDLPGAKRQRSSSRPPPSALRTSSEPDGNFSSSCGDVSSSAAHTDYSSTAAESLSVNTGVLQNAVMLPAVTVPAATVPAVTLPADTVPAAGSSHHVSAAGDNGPPQLTTHTPQCQVNGCGATQATSGRPLKTLDEDEKFMIQQFILKYQVSIMCNRHYLNNIQVPKYSKKCSNPLQKQRHDNRHCRLQDIGINRLRNIAQYLPDINLKRPTSKVCYTCIIDIDKEIEEIISSLNSQISIESEEHQSQSQHSLFAPSSSGMMSEDEVEPTSLTASTQTEDPPDENAIALNEMINNLKEKINGKSYNETLSILTLLPQSWTRKKIQDTMGITDYMSRKIKNMQSNSMTTPAARKRRKDAIEPQIVNRVTEFLKKDYVVRTFPDEKHSITVITDTGETELRPKRLLLDSMKETHSMFLAENPDLEGRIGITKFLQCK